MARPATGETTIGMMTLDHTTLQCTTTPATRAAPQRPPMRAWEEDEGSPNHHVIRFQAIAPTRAATTSHIPSTPSGWAMMPDPMVAATLLPKKAPKRLATAAIASATRGVSARVETEVAIALAASWKPLV